MSRKYNAYLAKHKASVLLAFEWLCDNVPDIVECEKVFENIWNHDNSKIDNEYLEYDAYFYPNESSMRWDAGVREQYFNEAWLHHIHNNPHHWQHHVLIHDDPTIGTTCLEMKLEDIVEMICDWWSFGWASGNLFEIFDWYDKHKDHIQLHPKTRALVEDILSKIKAKLN